MNYPNFMCVGQQKAGTGWLYDQLRSCDLFWCPPIKELKYFDDNFLKPANQKRIAASLNGLSKDGKALDEKDTDFYALVRSFKNGKPNTLMDYRELFSFADGKISGDISPSYSVLSSAKISQIKQNFGELKVVLLVRHPVDRTLSAFNMHIRHGKVSADVATNVNRIRRLVGRSNYRTRGYASRIWEKWASQFGAKAQYWFLEDIRRNPENTRMEIANFIGAREPVFSEASGFNGKADNRKIVFSDEVIEFLYDYYRQEIRLCADTFGGHALNWKTNHY